MAFPTSPKPRSIRIKSITPNMVSETHSMKRQVRQRGAHRWLIEATYPPMTRAQFAPIWAFVVAQKGQYSTFDYVPEGISSSSGNLVGTLVSGVASAGASTIASITGLQSGLLKAGDFIKFSEHDKVYMLTADIETDSGFSTITIEPPLLSAVSTDDTIVSESVSFKMALSQDQQETGIDVNSMHSFELFMIEIL